MITEDKRPSKYGSPPSRTPTHGTLTLFAPRLAAPFLREQTKTPMNSPTMHLSTPWTPNTVSTKTPTNLKTPTPLTFYTTQARLSLCYLQISTLRGPIPVIAYTPSADAWKEPKKNITRLASFTLSSLLTRVKHAEQLCLKLYSSPRLALTHTCSLTLLSWWLDTNLFPTFISRS